MGESVLEPIEDFARLKAAALTVPSVKQVVPMGIDQAMVSMGNVFDVALERLRADVRRRLDQGAPAEDPEYEAHKAHLRRMATLLQQELRQAREIADETSGVYKDRKADFDALEQAVQGGFWEQFDRDPLGLPRVPGEPGGPALPGRRLHLHPLRGHRPGRPSRGPSRAPRSSRAAPSRPGSAACCSESSTPRSG